MTTVVEPSAAVAAPPTWRRPLRRCAPRGACSPSRWRARWRWPACGWRRRTIRLPSSWCVRSRRRVGPRRAGARAAAPPRPAGADRPGRRDRRRCRHPRRPAVVEHRTLTGSVAWSWDLALRMSAALLPRSPCTCCSGSPTDASPTSVRRRAVATGYVVALVVGIALMADLGRGDRLAVIVLWAAALGFGMYASHVRYLKAGAVDRRRMQWVGWGIAVATEAVLVVVALRLLTDWPHQPGAGRPRPHRARAARPHAGTLPSMVARVDRLLTHTVALAGLTALVVAIYVVVVSGSGARPAAASARSCCCRWSPPASPPCSTSGPPLADRAGQPAGVRRARRARRDAAHVRPAPHPVDPPRRVAAAAGREPAQVDGAGVGRGVDGPDGRYERAAGVPHRERPAARSEPRSRRWSPGPA